MIKSADKDNTGFVSCNEFSDLLKQNLFDVAENLNVEIEGQGQGQGQRKPRKGNMHRSMIGKKPKGLRSTYISKKTMRR